MPQNKFALARYYMIDSLLHTYAYVKTSFIVDYCEKKTGYKVSRRTIQMDIESMKNDPFLGFNAPIAYCSNRKAYYYIDLSYQLIPFCFTSGDVMALEELLLDSENLLTNEQILLLKSIVQKMRMFVFNY